MTPDYSAKSLKPQQSAAAFVRPESAMEELLEAAARLAQESIKVDPAVLGEYGRCSVYCVRCCRHVVGEDPLPHVPNCPVGRVMSVVRRLEQMAADARKEWAEAAQPASSAVGAVDDLPGFIDGYGIEYDSDPDRMTFEARAMSFGERTVDVTA